MFYECQESAIYDEYIQKYGQDAEQRLKEDCKNSKSSCITCQNKEKLNPHTIFFTKDCQVVLHPNQSSLGRYTIIPKEHVTSYDIRFEDKKLLSGSDIIKKMTAVCKKLFRSDTLSNTLLVFPDQHCKIVITPRYEQPIERFGKTFSHDIDEEITLEDNEMKQIVNEMQFELIRSQDVTTANFKGLDLSEEAKEIVKNENKNSCEEKLNEALDWLDNLNSSNHVEETIEKLQKRFKNEKIENNQSTEWIDILNIYIKSLKVMMSWKN